MALLRAMPEAGPSVVDPTDYRRNWTPRPPRRHPTPDQLPSSRTEHAKSVKTEPQTHDPEGTVGQQDGRIDGSN